MHDSQAMRWTSPAPKANFGSRSETSWYPRSTERQDPSRATAASPSFASPSSLSESGHWESTSKQPFPFNHNVSNRRSFMSKPVYPLVFRNPVSDCETFGDADIRSVGGLTPGHDRVSTSLWPDNSSSIEHKFHKTISELQIFDDASPDPNTSSRREGFRWSSASSYEMGFGGESFDMRELMEVENLRSSIGQAGAQKCGVCGKMLWQKSPWGSHLIMRNSDMAVTGVLPCGHVFHAECLEQLTPKTQISDPPCPMCLKTGSVEDSPSVSQSLQMALSSVRSSRRSVNAITEAEDATNSSLDRSRRKLSSSVRECGSSGSSLKHHLKKYLTFKGKVSNEFFSKKVFHRYRSSSVSKSVRGRISIQ